MLREYLYSVRGFSRRTLAAVKHKGGKLLINGKEVTVRYMLQRNDVVEVIFPPETRSEFMKPQPISFPIIFEDDDVLVVNKPPFMATIPSRHHPDQTLANAILYHYDEQKLPYTVHVVTRLDRDTSGLILIAKHRYSHATLFQDQLTGRVNRRYVAIVAGHLKEKEGTINAAITRDPSSILKRMVSEQGQEAITHYKVVKECHGYSFVQVQLETGRTHQIRVHFTSIGHPLIGDSLYGGAMDKMARQALHCNKLTFHHPMTKEIMNFTLDLPKDMAPLLT